MTQIAYQANVFVYAEAMDRITARIMHDNNNDNRILQRNMRVFLAEAKRNEDKLQRLQSLELMLIDADSMSDLIDMLLYKYQRGFALDAVSLVLADPHHEIRGVLEDEGINLDEHPQLDFNPELLAHFKTLFRSPLPQLGPYKTEHHQQLFRKQQNTLSSVAVLPLVRHEQIIGYLNLGSSDDRRYLNGTGTELLQRLAAIVAICIENTLNLERLKRTGLTDALTSLNNRRFFDQRILEEIERARRNGQSLSCLFIDIDYFKKFNDVHGHQTGDEVLREVAKQLDSHMRRSDVLARFGGEEFAILLCNTDKPAAEETAERLRAAIESSDLTSGGKLLHISISVGVTTAYPANSTLNNEQQAEQLIELSDEALLIAKRNGRNQVCTLLPPAP